MASLMKIATFVVLLFVFTTGCAQREHLSYAEQMEKKRAYYNGLTQEQQIKAVKEQWWRIAFITNPSYEVQKVAMDVSGGTALGEIKKPTKEIQIQAVHQIMKDGSFNIEITKRISSFDDEAQIEAVKLNPQIIKFIPYPSPEVQLEAVKRNPFVIKNIINATEEAKKEAIKRNPKVAHYLEAKKPPIK